MFIRKEDTKDDETVYSVVKRSFDSAEHADGNEHDWVSALRTGESFIPELSLAAGIKGESDKRILEKIQLPDFALGTDGRGIHIRVHSKSSKKAKEKFKSQTIRKRGKSVREIIK